MYYVGQYLEQQKVVSVCSHVGSYLCIRKFFAKNFPARTSFKKSCYTSTYFLCILSGKTFFLLNQLKISTATNLTENFKSGTLSPKNINIGKTKEWYALTLCLTYIIFYIISYYISLISYPTYIILILYC